MAVATINAQHRKHFKAGCYTAAGCNLFADYGYRLTRSERHALVQAQFEDDSSAKAEARRVEIERRNQVREAQRQARSSPLPKPNFLKRCVSFLKGNAA